MSKPIYLKIERPEGYEDVADSLMLDDFLMTATTNDWDISLITPADAAKDKLLEDAAFLIGASPRALNGPTLTLCLKSATFRTRLINVNVGMLAKHIFITRARVVLGFYARPRVLSLC